MIWILHIDRESSIMFQTIIGKKTKKKGDIYIIKLTPNYLVKTK